MKYKNINRLFILVASLLIATSSFAKSPVFKITKGDSQIYIGGTIHLLSPSDYPLPSGFALAFEDSDRVFFETDTTQLALPENQAKFTSMMTLDGDKTLESELDEKTYTRLKKFLTERHIPIAGFNKFTPAAISFTLALIEIQRLGLGNPESGVDQFFELKARDAEMPRSYLETIEAQIGFLNELNSVDANEAVNANLDDMASLQNNWKSAVAAWRSGDFELMSQSLGGDKMKVQFPSIYKVLLTDRNNRWMSQIKPLFETEEVEFILVGALHLVEGNGLITQLEKGGYTVQQLD